jgi:hypothetical protein
VFYRDESVGRPDKEGKQKLGGNEKRMSERDKVTLDLFWLKDGSLEESDDLPEPDVLAPKPGFASSRQVRSGRPNRWPTVRSDWPSPPRASREDFLWKWCAGSVRHLSPGAG